MKKVLVGILALGATLANATILPLGGGDTEARSGVRLSADVSDQGAGFRLTLEAHVAALSATTLRTERGEFTFLNIPGFQQTGDIGSPSLPVMNQLLEVPQGSAVQVEVLSRSEESVDLAAAGFEAPLFPRQPPQVKDGSVTPFEYDRRSYHAAGFQQDALVQVQELGMMRDMRLVLVKVAPVAYDPVTGALEVTRDIQFQVRVDEPDMAATADTKQRLHSPYFEGLRRQILVPDSLRGLEPTTDRPRCYAIVADKALAEPLAPFVEWKKEQGFDVRLAYTDEIGADASAIATFTHALYLQPGDDHAAPDFLLLVGDHDNVPAKQAGSGWSSHITDLYYAAVTDDYLPDILSGRFSARTTAELVPQIQKTLEYEKFQMADPSFLEHVVLTAGWDSSHAVEWGWPQIKYGMENYFNAEHGIPNVSCFLSEGAHQNESAIISQVSSGAAFVNYTAHGSQTSWADPGFGISDVESLGNDGKYPLVLANCCVTSSFQVGKCFGESWLRAPGKGAIGYIGGSNNTYWDEDLWFGNGFYAIAHPNDDGAAPAREDTGEGAYDHSFADPFATSASLMLTGNLAVEQSNTSRKLYYWEVYHLFGDPSLQVYWGLPKDNPVQHSGQIVAREGSYDVQAAAGSYVGLSVDGELVGAGFAGDDGVAHLTLKALPASGEAKLVVTAKNRKPHFDKVTIGETPAP